MYKVLIVDANPQQLHTLSQSICWEDCGLEIVELLSDSRTALSYLQEHSVDILIANVRMPHIDGIQLLQNLRAHNPYTRCILLAEQTDFSCVSKAIPLDIENFLITPLDSQMLLDALLGAVHKIAHVQNAASAGYSGSAGSSGLTGRNSTPILINHTFEKHIINQEYAHCMTYVDNLFATVSAETNTIPASVRNHTVELVVCILNVLRNCNIEVTDIIGDDSELFHKILRFEDIQQLHTWMKNFLQAAVDALESKNMRFSPCISRVVAHIEKNFAQDISLKTMAYDLNINAAYLGQMFKLETGQLFSVYLNRVRIDNAQKLLLQTNCTLSEVSQQCGYANISYFYNIFKKITGQTPSQYRKTKTQ